MIMKSLTIIALALLGAASASAEFPVTLTTEVEDFSLGGNGAVSCALDASGLVTAVGTFSSNSVKIYERDGRASSWQGLRI